MARWGSAWRCAALLADRGARVVIVGRGAAALDDALAQLPGSGHERVALDVSDAAAWPDAMTVVDAGGALDGVVTAAGVLGRSARLTRCSARRVRCDDRDQSRWHGARAPAGAAAASRPLRACGHLLRRRRHGSSGAIRRLCRLEGWSGSAH